MHARYVPGALPVVDAEQPWLATLYVPGPTSAGALDGRALRTLGLGLAEALSGIQQPGL